MKTKRARTNRITDNIIKAAMSAVDENIISCRATSGIQLASPQKWVAGESVEYIYMPGGTHTITAGFRKNESITVTVDVDEKTADDIQESFDHITATENQEPYADEDHESKKATLRFPASKVKFVYGKLKNDEGVIVQGAEPTSYGAESVNGKVYRSWSPEFATDAEYAKAKQKKGHWTFPDGVRGSASNPARIIAINFVTGALTNKPAFRAMPPVKAKKVEVEKETVQAKGNSEGAKKGWASRPKGKYTAMVADFWKCPHCKEKIHESKLLEPSDQKVWDAGFSECPNCHGNIHPDTDSLTTKASSRFTPEALADEDGAALGELRDLVTAAAESGCVALDVAGETFAAVVKAGDGKIFKTSFSIEDDETIKLGERTEVTDAEMISAVAAGEFRFNGEVVKAAWSDAARKASAEARKVGSKVTIDANEHDRHGQEGIIEKVHKEGGIGSGVNYTVKFNDGHKERFGYGELKNKSPMKATDQTVTDLDVIFARKETERQAVGKLADRVPATKTRDDLEKIYARTGVNG